VKLAGRTSAATITTQDLIRSVRWDDDAKDIVIETETGKKNQSGAARTNRNLI